MSKTRKRDRDTTNEILICCHAAWNADRDGYFKVPEDVYLYVYAPHGAALTAPIPRVVAPGKDALESKDGSGIIVENIDVAKGKTLRLSELLCREQFRNKVCHFGGCSWVSSESNRRDIVIFKDEAMNDKYTVKITEEEKRLKRAERFGKK